MDTQRHVQLLQEISGAGTVTALAASHARGTLLSVVSNGVDPDIVLSPGGEGETRLPGSGLLRLDANGAFSWFRGFNFARMMSVVEEGDSIRIVALSADGGTEFDSGHTFPGHALFVAVLDLDGAVRETRLLAAEIGLPHVAVDCEGIVVAGMATAKGPALVDALIDSAMNLRPSTMMAWPGGGVVVGGHTDDEDPVVFGRGRPGALTADGKGPGMFLVRYGP